MSKQLDEQPWHVMDVDQVTRELDTDVDRGLNDEEVAARLNLYGPNRLTEHAGPSAWKLFAGQFADFIIWVLIGAAVISALLGEVVDSAAIFVIVVANAILGFIQEYKAEQSLAALRKMANPVSRVVRDGETIQVLSEQVVPGDIIELESGDNIPADIRIVSNTANFAAQESALTGESVPVLKSSDAMAKPDIPLGDRSAMVYMGTSVTDGKARGVVVATGMRAELGKIAGLIQEIPREITPLQKKLEQFGKWIVYLSIGLVVVIFIMGLWRGYEVLWMFMTTVSLAVAAIPEGLPAVVTISLALGVQRMVRRHALIRKLPSVETLGCATVICSDKTGTLTRNEMTVKKIWVGGRLIDVTGTGYAPDGSFMADRQTLDPATDPELRDVLVSASLCNGARLRPPVDDKSWHIVGDPTEGALLVAAAKAGLTLDKLETEFPLIEEYPFDSERKRMTILRRHGDGVTAHIKGAPDVLLDRCTCIQDGDSDRSITDDDRSAILDINDRLASQAIRVLAVARRDLADGYKAGGMDDIEQDLVFLGLVGMIDPARPEVRDAIERCHHAGIRPVMITGDHLTTAVAVAKEVGSFDADAEAFTGADINRMDDDELFNEVDKIAVYARVSAEHKLRIVRAWRKKGHVVAMTGDGVNDAPALKEADIGVAMGITGTDVTKEVADMVVTDDNFASIVNAVEEGRGIYDNIKKFVNYLLSCNFGEVLVLFSAVLIGMKNAAGDLVLPLVPIQILWMNIVTDGLPALAIGVDPPEPHIMERPPRGADDRILSRSVLLTIMVVGCMVAVATLLAWDLEIRTGNENAQTVAFTTIVMAQMVVIQLVRSQYKIGVFSNPYLVAAVASSVVLQLIVIYVPFLQPIFHTHPLALSDWLVVGGACLLVYVVGILANRFIIRR